MTITLAPDLLWTGERFERHRSVTLDDDGTIAVVGSATNEAARLIDRALLPGFVNAHSHAFQRGLRFRPQVFPQQAGTFWTWRDTMYGLVESLDPDSCYAISRHCFEDMLAAGITTVGEFHYVHHGSDFDWAMDDALLQAADDAGIRLVLLQTFYATGGIGRPLEGAQSRFDAGSLETFLQQMDELERMLRSPAQTLGVACHSIRAAAIPDLVALHEHSVREGWVFHVHVEEQDREIEDCRGAYGSGPLRIILDQLKIDERFTAVHCTHSVPEDLNALADAGASVCLCPLTEANLGDGIPDWASMSGGRVCIGTDCNLRLSMLEELRSLEFAQRLSRESCGAVVDHDGRCANRLLSLATVNGAHSLGVRAGHLEPGAVADMFTINLEHPTLSGWNETHLLDSIVFGCGNAEIAERWVNGRLV